MSPSTIRSMPKTKSRYQYSTTHKKQLRSFRPPWNSQTRRLPLRRPNMYHRWPSTSSRRPHISNSTFNHLLPKTRYEPEPGHSGLRDRLRGNQLRNRGRLSQGRHINIPQGRRNGCHAGDLYCPWRGHARWWSKLRELAHLQLLLHCVEGVDGGRGRSSWNGLEWKLACSSGRRSPTRCEGHRNRSKGSHNRGLNRWCRGRRNRWFLRTNNIQHVRLPSCPVSTSAFGWEIRICDGRRSRPEPACSRKNCPSEPRIRCHPSLRVMRSLPSKVAQGGPRGRGGARAGQPS
jgi:hypothetical protein